MGGEENHQHQYRELLQTLKSTAEGLLINQVSNVWNIYGGLNRLHHVMERIFKHGCRIFNQEGEPDCWIFIQGLNWLQPSLAVSPTFLTDFDRTVHNLPPNVNEKALIWIYKSLEGHTLSQKLSWLLSDREHLLSCFEKTAYLCQEKYGEATLICLRAVEQNQPSLLAEIDPCLYLSTWTYNEFQKTHRRCSSFPETQHKTWHFAHSDLLGWKKQCSEDSQANTTSVYAKADYNAPSSEIKDTTCSYDSDRVNSCEEATESIISCQESENVENGNTERNKDIQTADDNISEMFYSNTKLKRWKSLPDILGTTFIIPLCKRSFSASSKSLYVNKVFFQCTSGSHVSLSCPADDPRLDQENLQGSNIGQMIENVSGHQAYSKLSPSVLQVDYSAEPTPDHEPDSCVTDNRLAGHWKQQSAKQQTRSLNKKLTKGCSNNFKKPKTAIPKNLTLVESSTIASSTSSSSSSDTINVNRHLAESSEVIRKANKTATTCKARPSDLNLPSRHWRKSEINSSGMPSARNLQRKRKTGISGSVPNYPFEWLGDRQHCKKSFIEDGGSSVLPMTVGFFPRPQQGQSITSFLSSVQFARPAAELDRENAHFSISEAIIAAIEQMKCNRKLCVSRENNAVGEESDEDMYHLKQRIRIRRRQCQEEKQHQAWNTSLLSDGKTDTTTTDQSVSPLSTSPGTPSESISTDDVDDLEIDEVKNLTELKDAGLSVSMASLYSEADLSRPPVSRTGTDVPLTESIVSAEGVALSLIRKFSEKQLPRASDLQWLVSEQDAPQQLLPLPTSWPISPDEAEDMDMHLATPLRGTMEWAPPRPQVIFTLHPPPVRRTLMVKQNYRCAGCGMKVAPEYSNRFRYCEYLGRYFCTGCHTGQLAPIPGRILTKWDFTRCPVSTFSYRLLDQMIGDPLFIINDLNPGLYRKAKQLEKCRQLRLQLCYLKDFIFLCRFAESLQEGFRREPTYIYTQVDTYSIQDLIEVKNGTLLSRLSELVNASLAHTEDCELCQARGFVCELCHAAHDVIFPWQLGTVTRCGNCGSCFHSACWSPAPCPRCERISARRKSCEEIPEPVEPP
ncbi:run domain Beclin-1-interacting and cysteine-rich domain-containing protein isoform X1 [Schistocerca nitens]|uniref:run domain Beclin-1-interacting and cysteine-rich domain-containing protein isoform X1 n=1 Tax=Schistocerca nitens TaxID=7011 RepID=UPI0021183731|nr:run domain Beclin-1-interacting and cysteine-rich domain-containing protein isoform X1 [Schistocerca nitens]